MSVPPILPADRRLRLYLGTARRLRRAAAGDVSGVRRACIELAWQARAELRARQ